MTNRKHIDGHYYHDFHPGWGGFCEELFHYTSRYYAVTEGFLKVLAERPVFSMSGYKAQRLSAPQRVSMATILGYPPEQKSGSAVISIVEKVVCGEPGVDEELLQLYPPKSGLAERVDSLVGHANPPRPLDVTPLEPWLSMAERLLMPVAVREHHVEVDMRVLAQHLDSANPVIRSNLQQVIVALHEAGYLLRNHPHLTHSEAHEIADEGAV
jgi:hypothetical protein